MQDHFGVMPLKDLFKYFWLVMYLWLRLKFIGQLLWKRLNSSYMLEFSWNLKQILFGLSRSLVIKVPFYFDANLSGRVLDRKIWLNTEPKAYCVDIAKYFLEFNCSYTLGNIVKSNFCKYWFILLEKKSAFCIWKWV